MSLRPVDSTSTFSIVHPDDSAVDPETSDFKGFWEAIAADPSGWQNFLKLKEGQVPTKYVIGVIRPADLCRIEDECGVEMFTAKVKNPTQLYWKCFLLSLRDIVDGPTMEITTQAGRVEHRVPKQKHNGQDVVDPAWLENVFSRGNRVVGIFIGSVAYHWQKMTDDDAKKSSGR